MVACAAESSRGALPPARAREPVLCVLNGAVAAVALLASTRLLNLLRRVARLEAEAEAAARRAKALEVKIESIEEEARRLARLLKAAAAAEKAVRPRLPRLLWG